GGIVWEDIEQAPAQDRVALRHGGAEVGLAHRHDPEIGRQDEVEAGRPLEQQAEVRLLHVEAGRWAPWRRAHASVRTGPARFSGRRAGRGGSTVIRTT